MSDLNSLKDTKKIQIARVDPRLSIFTGTVGVVEVGVVRVDEWMSRWACRHWSSLKGTEIIQVARVDPRLPIFVVRVVVITNLGHR
jgi:hypothetical protein